MKNKFIDLHTHTLFSDGELLPSELVYRAKSNEYVAIALTDHTDFSNLDFIIPRLVKVAEILESECEITVIPGVELTYIPPNRIKEAAQSARKLGARIIVVHGETPAEIPVPAGTNAAALTAEIDILAHPGFIKPDLCQLAKEKNIVLEITTRKGHKEGNLHIVDLARKIGTKLVINTDTHSPNDLLNYDKIKEIQRTCNLSTTELNEIYINSVDLVKRISLPR